MENPNLDYNLLVCFIKHCTHLKENVLFPQEIISNFARFVKILSNFK